MQFLHVLIVVAVLSGKISNKNVYPNLFQHECCNGNKFILLATNAHPQMSIAGNLVGGIMNAVTGIVGKVPQHGQYPWNGCNHANPGSKKNRGYRRRNKNSKKNRRNRNYPYNG